MALEPLDLPPGFLDRVRAILPANELADFLRALTSPPDGLRVNTLRLSANEFLQMSPFALRRLPSLAEGFVVDDATARPGKHPYHSAGMYYLQDPGAMLAGHLAGALPGERVLDLAAAPGGKATHLAARLCGEGVLVANDISRSRARELGGNLERCGVRNSLVLAETPERLAAHFGPWFDRVLVDAPCSGESMFARSSAALEDWSEAVVAGCAGRQGPLLRTAAQLVRPGGTLVYSTCTFSQEENEAIIENFLDSEREFEPAPLPDVPGAEPIGARAASGEPAAYRLWPHRVAGAGHFVAMLRRVDAIAAAGMDAGLSRATVPREALRALETFMDLTYPGSDLDVGSIATFGEELYQLPADAPPTAGLRVIRSGLWCGTWRSNRFEPAHSLALATPLRSAADPLDLTLEDERVVRYLHGHPIESEGSPGWVPVGVDGFPLGWGKRVGRVVKNHYPKGLRWRG